MKKSIALLMACAFTMSAFAQYLVYDYKVSMKRVDPVYSKVTYSFNEYDGKAKSYVGYFDSFKSTSDSLAGYIAIPACEDCSADGWAVFGSAAFTPAIAAESDALIVNAEDDNADDAWAYIVRNGDNLYKNPIDNFGLTTKLVWKLKANVDTAMFNKDVAVRLVQGACFTGNDELQGGPTSLKKIKEAWMVLSYDVENSYTNLAYPPVKGLKPTTTGDCPTETINYGFMGYQSIGGSMSHAGFGTITATGTPGSSTVGFCGGVVVDPTKCIAIKSISGTIVGLFNYEGFCSDPAMFDICDEFIKLDVAPISGNWTVKLNNSLSKKYGASLDAIEDYIAGKYNVNFFVLADGTEYLVYGVVPSAR